MRILEWKQSDRANKKYAVLLSTGKWVHFGSSNHDQYKDTTPLKLYSNRDHLDEKRKELYYKRHKKNYEPYSADWLSKRFLWR